jgi:arsenate reductase
MMHMTQQDNGQEQRIYNVLFLCTANSARSIMAEGILNSLGRGQFRGFSAGSQPSGSVHPQALKALQLAGFEYAGMASKSWDVFATQDAPQMDFVFTVCNNAANEICPVWPGHPITANWGVPDPAATVGSDVDVSLAFSQSLRMLRGRIEAFISLPLASLDRLSLQHKVDAIGQGDQDAKA